MKYVPILLFFTSVRFTLILKLKIQETVVTMKPKYTVVR